jgi:hypothetical protein
VEVQSSVVIEKADSKLGVIIFKCLAVTPGVEDADGDIIDKVSMEKAFYDFMDRHAEIQVDLDHKEDVAGHIVAGWYFPDENLYRVAFKPDDASIIELAESGELAGSSFSGVGRREAMA